MLETLTRLDSELLLWFNSHSTPFFDSFFWLFSGKLIWIGLYLAIIMAMFRQFGWRITLGMLLSIGIIIALTDQICGNFLRHAVERLRPTNPENPLSSFVHIVNGYRGGAFGFPSCHAANSFALAAFIMLVFRCRPLTIAIYAWALLTAYSRMVLGVHYPGDLLVGAIIGSCVSLGVFYLSRAVYRRYFATRPDFSTDLHPERNRQTTRLIISALLLTVFIILILSL